MADNGVNMGPAEFVRATDRAILVAIESIPNEDVWIPKSQIHDDSELYEEGTDGDLVVTEWFAEQRGWR